MIKVKCNLCGNTDLVKVLDKQQTTVWIGILTDKKFPAKLLQCRNCGHIQQPLDKELADFLNEVYQSENAQASTQVGGSNWGKKRAEKVLQQIDLQNVNSAMEIGCANGYLLKCLQSKGVSNLVGVEPSIKEDIKGIRFVKAFVNQELDLNEKFDLIYSVAVFEHIKDINGVMKFVRNHLNKEGKLLIVVPAFQRRVETGDPGLFMHEHLHYFTLTSLNFLLKTNGFNVIDIKEKDDSYYIYADLGCISLPIDVDFKIYDDYESNLNILLDKIHTQQGTFAFHGVCNSLNNVISWSSFDNFGLFDNDEARIGKNFFGMTVKKPSNININNFSNIIVIPTAYYDEIKEQYEKLGFKGNMISLIELGGVD